MTTPRPADGRPVPLSVLDLGNAEQGTSAEQAVQDIAGVAVTADEHGYRRFWVAEHHSSRNTVSSAPVVLIAHLAARTGRIRVGSGGVMLPNHAPYTVAEQFATLQALHPGRIDLGVGRASGGTATIHALLEAALRRDPRAAAEFPDRIDELVGFLTDTGPHGGPPSVLKAAPRVAEPPEVYVLGAGAGGAVTAAQRSLPFVYGHHLGRGKGDPESVARYRADFVPGPRGARPYVIAALNVLCADTDAQAERLAVAAAGYRLAHREETVPDAPSSPAEQERQARQRLDDDQVLHGGPDAVAEGVERFAKDLDADEVMLVPYDVTGAGRSRTLRLAASRGLD